MSIDEFHTPYVRFLKITGEHTDGFSFYILH